MCSVFVIGKYMCHVHVIIMFFAYYNNTSLDGRTFAPDWVNSTGHSAQKRRDSVARVRFFFSLAAPPPGVAVQSDDGS